MTPWPMFPATIGGLCIAALLAACTREQVAPEPGASAVELRGALEQRALLQSEYQRIR